MILPIDTYNGLRKIASKTGTNCWFWTLAVTNQDVLYHIGDERIITWEDALSDMLGKITRNFKDYELSQPEIDGVIKLLKRFKLI